MNIIADNIKTLCKNKGITMVRFETDCELSHGYVRTLDRQNSVPSIERLTKIANYFDVSVDFLLGKEVKNRSNGVLIPLVGRVAAGMPIDAVENVIGQEEISEKVASLGEHFALKIKGDSMSPFIMNGDIVIVRQQPDAEEGDIVIALINGHDGVCKKYKRIKGGIALMSINSAYEPMVFVQAEIDTTPVQILGKVIEIRRSL